MYLSQFFDVYIKDMWRDNELSGGKTGGGKPAATTIANYQVLVRKFVRSMPIDSTPSEFDEVNYLRFMYELTGAKTPPSTIRQYHAALRSFSAWLLKRGALKSNPTDDFKLPTLPQNRHRTKYATTEECLSLLEAAGRIRNEYRASLAKAVLAVYIYAGLRRAEGLNLNVTDIDLNTGEIRIRNGKGGKDRVDYMCDEGLVLLREYVARRPMSAHRTLFLRTAKTPMALGYMLGIIDEAKAIAGFRDATHLTPHSLRHGYATRLMRAGVDLETIKEKLGHSFLSTTAIYLHADAARIKEVRQQGSLKPSPPANSSTSDFRRL